MATELYSVNLTDDHRATTNGAGSSVTADLEATFYDGAPKHEKLLLVEQLKNSILENK